MRVNILLIICVLQLFSCEAQHKIEEYLGGWAGEFKNQNPFAFNIEVDLSNSQKPVAIFKGRNNITKVELKKENNQYLVGQFKKQLIIRIDTTDNQLVTFIQTGHHLSNIELNRSETNKWIGKWNLLIGENINPTLYLALEKANNEGYYASTFFKEPTLHYTFGQNFTLNDTAFSFLDIRSNIKLKGILKEKSIDLTLDFLNEQTTFNLETLPYDEWEIGIAEKGKREGDTSQEFSKLISDVQNDTLEGTHAVVISQNNKVIFESYFDGFTANTMHDSRSLSKSFAGTAIGLAIADKKIDNENIAISNILKNQYPDIDWGEKKDEITIHHLITMSSGLDAIDFGLNRNSFANEGAYQSSENWTKHVLSAPMVYSPGEQANYGSGNPHLVGPIIDTQIGERIEFYIHKKLFQPLSINNYRIQTNNEDQVYFGGGWYFTPRDLVKFGELYLNNGTWKNQQILTEEWVKKSMDKYFVLENTRDKNEYGYLFWHKTYNVNGQEIASVEGRGNGGQYLFIVPQYNLVVAITSGNYRNNRGFQPEKIMNDYILPVIAN